MWPHRSLLKAILVLAFTASILAQAQAADQKPNILLVVADDMGWTDLGSFGSEIDTPNLDALAEQGLKFTDFHVSISCSPGPQPCPPGSRHSAQSRISPGRADASRGTAHRYRVSPG